jgi:hypothetical protein
MPEDGSPTGLLWPFFRGPFSSVPDFLLLSVRISHFQLRLVTAILAE